MFGIFQHQQVATNQHNIFEQFFLTRDKKVIWKKFTLFIAQLSPTKLSSAFGFPECVGNQTILIVMVRLTSLETNLSSRIVAALMLSIPLNVAEIQTRSIGTLSYENLLMLFNCLFQVIWPIQSNRRAQIPALSKLRSQHFLDLDLGASRLNSWLVSLWLFISHDSNKILCQLKLFVWLAELLLLKNSVFFCPVF